ncbi:MAG: hypothetical protein PUF52_05595 [Prevotella sp.]|nr:hypothetical protein [Prevotella sp.]
MLTVITFSLVPFTFSHVPSDEEQSVIVAVVLAFIYAPRTWCFFCPMGTLSSWVAPKSGHLPDGYRGIKVGDNCTKKCKMCARVCPMQLNTYEARGNGEGFNHPDCIKCGKCTLACPMRACSLK